MKKILSVFCCVLYMRSVSQVPVDMRILSGRSSGEKIIVKAITAIVNREGKRRGPCKRVHLPSSGSLWI